MNQLQVVKHLKRRLNIPFFMDIVILRFWSIWTTRNEWIFNQIDPTIDNCIRKFFRELKMVIHRAKAKHVQPLREWIQARE
ncbi:hypothetical protein HU200_013947 [Digitaria exilis]|uniref:Uncharacterized protein n=1 Tax=Digitaria exilis TaxID=1010633 RepID=A0A835FCE6_9POAL|nr:hypothetical protein HU200_013947 [Digitaria exilis]